MNNLLIAAYSGLFILQSDTLSGDESAVARAVVEADSLEPLVEALEDPEESSVLDLVEERPVAILNMRSRLARKLQPARAYLDHRYSGSSYKLYQRITLAAGDHAAAGVLLEKDPGESKINDFTTGYFLLRGIGPIQSLIGGDYVVEAGQGIALWRGYDFAKGADVILPVKRRERTLLPYASSDENSFMRGAAVHVRWDDMNLVAFYSRRALNATLDTLGAVSSIYTAGYFRTQTEIGKRNALTESVAGVRALYVFSDHNQIGFTGYTSVYSRDFARTHVKGRRFVILSADYQISLRSVDVFGEWSHNNASIGGVTGIHYQPEKSFEVITAFRSYPQSFHSIHNNGFGERWGTANEHGWYLGVRALPLRRIRVSVFYDLFSFPDHSSTTLFAGGGHEIFFQAELAPLPRLVITPRFRTKTTIEKKSAIDEFARTLHFDDEKRKNSHRITVDYHLNRITSVRWRLEYTSLEFHYLHRKEQGLMVYSDVVAKPSSGLLLNARVAVFRTDSFDAGIGEYERDVPGALSVPVLYGRGVRWYLLVQYSLFPSVRFSVKYSELIRDDVQTIGSGLEEILTNRDNRIAVQFDGSW